MTFFEDVAVGDVIPMVDYGPFTIGDGVRWAGCLELWNPLHFDREYAKECGLRTFIASGAYRQALLMRRLNEWIRPYGRIKKLSLRHRGPVFEGDGMSFGGTVRERSERADDAWLVCVVEGRNQHGDVILTGECRLVLGTRGN